MTARVRPTITLEQVTRLILDWGEKNISSKQLHDWCETNYLPLHADIALKEPSHTLKAINIILNEFEQADPRYTVPHKHQYALAFLKSSESNYEKRLKDFISQCFIPKELK